MSGEPRAARGTAAASRSETELAWPGTFRPATGPCAATAARSFYVDALRGRQVWETMRAERDGSMRFLLGGRLVEVSTEGASDVPPLVLYVDDPYEVAERCWDAGFSVRVREDVPDGVPVSVVDPFGRRIDLAFRRSATSPRRAAGEE